MSVSLRNLHFQTKTIHRHYTSQGTAGTTSALERETKPRWVDHAEVSAGHPLFRSGPSSSLSAVHVGSESSDFSDEDSAGTLMLSVTELTSLWWLWAGKHSQHFPPMNSCNPHSVLKAVLLWPPSLTPVLQIRKLKHSNARSLPQSTQVSVTELSFKTRQPTDSLSSTDNLKNQTIFGEMAFLVL